MDYKIVSCVSAAIALGTMIAGVVGYVVTMGTVWLVISVLDLDFMGSIMVAGLIGAFLGTGAGISAGIPTALSALKIWKVL